MTSPDGIAAPAPFGRRDGAAAGRRISISVTLAVGIGLLVFAAVAVVLALSVAAVTWPGRQTSLAGRTKSSRISA